MLFISRIIFTVHILQWFEFVPVRDDERISDQEALKKFLKEQDDKEKKIGELHIYHDIK